MQRSEIRRGRAIIARWRDLADERLAHLTELFESGRWRLYFTEAALLDNLREAKSAAETWHLLASQEALPDNTPLDLSWLDSERPLPARRRLASEPEIPASAVTIRIAAQPGPAATPLPPASTSGPAPVLDLSMMYQRYPLLRTPMPPSPI